MLEISNNQIEMLIDVEKNISDILNNSYINYDIEIINIRIKEIQEEIKKYELLKESIKDDFELEEELEKAKEEIISLWEHIEALSNSEESREKSLWHM